MEGLGRHRPVPLGHKDVRGQPLLALQALKDLELENSGLSRAVSDLTLDKLILQEAARGNF